VGVDKQFDVAFDCVGGEMGCRVAWTIAMKKTYARNHMVVTYFS